MHRRRSEVPKNRIIGVAREQRPAAELVAFPFADFGRRDVADIVDVENEQRAELGFLQRLLDAAEPITVQPAVIDPLLEIDAHGAERRQGPTPVVARVDVVGVDLADGLVHGCVSSRILLLGRRCGGRRCANYSARLALKGTALLRGAASICILVMLYDVAGGAAARLR